MKYRGPAMVAALGIVFGWLIWEFSLTFTGLVEPWDSKELYYWWALFLSGVVASLPSPRWFWCAAMGVCLGQSAYLMSNATGPLWPLGLGFGALFSGVAMFGGWCVFLIARLLRKGRGESK
ncbi:MAG TPA: hypothetical protein VFC86_10950 [Planctomycetota bacterium]|nr:hypothetical protein [Planctomycetota bacterium]